MKKHLSLTLSLVFALTLAVAFTGCGGQGGSDAGGDAADAAPSTSSAPAPAAKDEPAPAPAEEPEAAPEAEAAPAAAAGDAITAESLAGTKWKFGDVASFTFQEGGTLMVNDSLPGKWSIEGNKLTVTAMGATYVADIEGSKILYNGDELIRQ